MTKLFKRNPPKAPLGIRFFFCPLFFLGEKEKRRGLWLRRFG
jgi:hypothetical protein